MKINKLNKIIGHAIAMLTVSLTALSTQAQSLRNTTEYNLEMNIGIKGYDPVSYFSEGGGLPLMGSSDVILNYIGVTYQFSNPKNRELFLKNPNKYEPTYGGWCAYAMASGSKVDIQPLVYTISGNRLHFFVSKRAKQNFDLNVSDYESKADGFWKQISSEEPRL
jgi:YHS domain-containing protein